MYHECPQCGETDLSWVSRRFGHCVRRAGKQRNVREVRGVYSAMARFPGDPEVRVGSERELRQLVDRRKAQGWTEVRPDDIERATPKSGKGLFKGGARLFEESLQEVLEGKVDKEILKETQDSIDVGE